MKILSRESVTGLAAAALLVTAVSGHAATISGNTYSVEVDQLASSISLTSGSYSSQFGTLADAIDGDATTGAINVGRGVELDIGFASSVSNGLGDDLLFLDGRFDAADIQISLDGGLFFSITSEFVSTGIDERLFGCCDFTVYEARVDLSDYGFGSGFSFNTVSLLTIGNGLDLMDVGSFSGASVAPVPLPASLPLLLVGFGAFAVMRRKSR